MTQLFLEIKNQFFLRVCSGKFLENGVNILARFCKPQSAFVKSADSVGGGALIGSLL